MGPLFVACFVASLVFAFTESAWFLVAAVVAAWFGRGYIIGIVDVVRNPVRDVDIIIEPLGIGFLAGGERWYVHMDGVLSIRKIVHDIWTVAHHNGTLFNVPADTMPDECVTHIQSAIALKWDYLQPFADAHKSKIDANAGH